MVDLDVGFRQSPMLLVEDFMRDPSQDILVQVGEKRKMCLLQLSYNGVARLD
jgi:hypothetical protein